MRRHAVRHDFGQTRANPQCVLRNASEGERDSPSRRVEDSRSRAIIVLSPSGFSAASRQRYVPELRFSCIKEG